MKLVWAILALIISVALLYGQFLANPPVFDDIAFFQSEEFSYYLHFFSFDLRWLPYATFVWTRELLGDAILWLRLGNLLLHLSVVITLFLFLRRLFDHVLPKTNGQSLSPVGLAFFAALLFALHPIAVYAAGYLVQRTTLMATLFALLTWRCFLEGLLQEKRAWLILSALFYLLAGLSKEHSIMTPAISMALLLLLETPTKPRIKWLLPSLVLYALIGLFIVYQIKNKHILGQAYEPLASELLSRLSGDINPSLVYPLSILTQTFVFFKYVWLWFIPNPAFISVDICQTFTLRLWSMPETLGIFAFILYGAFAIRLLLKRGLEGLLGFALLCPWLLFCTELATVRIQEIVVLYRSYLWMIFLFASLPFFCQKLTAKQATITLSCITVLLLPLSYARLMSFSHPLLLWDDAARHIVNAKTCPNMDRILNNRGMQLLKLARYDEAINDLTRSLEVLKGQKKPMVSELANNYYNLAVAYLRNGQYQQAVTAFNVIVEPLPDPLPKGWQSFYFNKAEALEGLHELVAAKQYYEKACLQQIPDACNKQKQLEHQ